MQKFLLALSVISVLLLILTSCVLGEVDVSVGYTQDDLGGGIYGDLNISYTITNTGSSTISSWELDFEISRASSSTLYRSVSGSDLEAGEVVISNLIVDTSGIEVTDVDYDINF